MKKILFSLAVMLTAFVASAQFTSARLTAAGLTCAMCTKAIYNALEKIPSIKKVNPDIQNSSFAIDFKEGKAVDPDVLKAAVEEAGFSVSSLSLTGRFSNVAVSNNAHVTIGGKVFHFVNVGKTVLNGDRTLKMVDKKFVSNKEFRQYEAGGAHPCLESGKAEQCCPGGLAMNHSRIYHVTM